MSKRTAAALARGADVVRVAAQLTAAGKVEEAAEYRRAKTEHDPMTFALVYLSRHLTDKATGKLSLSDVHVAWAKTARRWARTETKPSRNRRAEIAPRNMGKSTWFFLLLPMWGAAHRHVSFAAAFAHTAEQAETHLATFKAELENNVLLRHDFPDLTSPKTRNRGTVAADRVSLYHAKQDFVFSAAGADGSTLGLKVGDRRPDLLILDDMEPDEGRYSAELAQKRLRTLREAILPLNIYARVIMVGTVTMQGSIVHQIVRYQRGEVDAPDDDRGNAWVGEERIKARHWLPILTLDDGTRVSAWPEKWPLDFLEEIEGTRQYAKNYANDPLGADGDYWQIDDFREATDDTLAGITHEVISLDPAVTSKSSSDYSAVASVGYSRPAKRGNIDAVFDAMTPGGFQSLKQEATGKCVVYECLRLRVPPDELRLAIIGAISRALGRGHVVLVIVETNQGGELWRPILHDLPVRVKTFTVSDPKPVRAAEALNHYQRKRVEHVRKGRGIRDAEGEMVAFPRAPNDDTVDAIGAGVRYFLSPKQRVKAGGQSVAYA